MVRERARSHIGSMSTTKHCNGQHYSTRTEFTTSSNPSFKDSAFNPPFTRSLKTCSSQTVASHSTLRRDSC
jgi:hypothetical protein